MLSHRCFLWFPLQRAIATVCRTAVTMTRNYIIEPDTVVTARTAGKTRLERTVSDAGTTTTEGLMRRSVSRATVILSVRGSFTKSSTDFNSYFLWGVVAHW